LSSIGTVEFLQVVVASIVVVVVVVIVRTSVVFVLVVVVVTTRLVVSTIFIAGGMAGSGWHACSFAGEPVWFVLRVSQTGLGLYSGVGLASGSGRAGSNGSRLSIEPVAEPKIVPAMIRKDSVS